MLKIYPIFNGSCCFTDKCNQRYDCSDKSDELNCSCTNYEFQCYCYKNNPVDCKAVDSYEYFRGCIPIKEYNDGMKQCPDGSDENDETKAIVSCDHCDVIIRRLYSITYQNLINVFLVYVITQLVTMFLLFIVLLSLAMQQILFVRQIVLLIQLNNVIVLFNVMMVL